MIELGRLHQTWNRKPEEWERGTGQTTRMLVEAMQQCDFLEPGSRIVIEAFSMSYAIDLLRLFVWLGYDMDYDFYRTSPTEITEERTGVIYMFTSRDMRENFRRFEGMRIAMAFQDHYDPHEPRRFY